MTSRNSNHSSIGIGFLVSVEYKEEYKKVEELY